MREVPRAKLTQCPEGLRWRRGLSSPDDPGREHRNAVRSVGRETPQSNEHDNTLLSELNIRSAIPLGNSKYPQCCTLVIICSLQFVHGPSCAHLRGAGTPLLVMSNAGSYRISIFPGSTTNQSRLPWKQPHRKKGLWPSLVVGRQARGVSFRHLPRLGSGMHAPLVVGPFHASGLDI